MIINRIKKYEIAEVDISNQDVHKSVMPKEILEYLAPREGAIFVDGTLGLGGHARLILECIGPKGILIGIDRDESSLNNARENLSQYASQCHFVHNNVRNIDVILNDLNIKQVDGMLLDLGISSFQLDNPQRGFSFRFDGPLDMRMDQHENKAAYDLINSLSEKELSKILKEYGEERFHNRIARGVVQQRSKKPIKTTEELVGIILKAMPYRPGKRESIHPATRSFQGIRIAVNRELESLEVTLNKCINFLRKGGRLGVISFHSLEDRIVKQKFRFFEQSELGKNLFKKPLQPTESETRENPRARSAKLRVIERI